MIRVKTFTSQLRIFHTMQELDDLDRMVNDFLASRGARQVYSVSDTSTAGSTGETIGIIRVLTYEEPPAGVREYEEKAQSALKEWGGEIDRIRAKAEGLGADARRSARRQVEELRRLQGEASRKLSETRKAGGEAWEELRAGADAALDELGKAVGKALGKMRGS